MVYLVDHKTFDGENSANPGTSDPAAASPVKTADNRLQFPPPRAAPIPSGPPATPWVQGPSELVQPLSWDIFAQGEYIGPARLQHVPEYYLRVDDQIGFVFRVNGKPTTTPYRLNVGDVIRVSSLTMPNMQFDTPVQPDGTIILPQVGSVTAAGKSMETLRTELDERFRRFLKEPSITVVPVTINRNLEELRSADQQPQRYLRGPGVPREGLAQWNGAVAGNRVGSGARLHAGRVAQRNRNSLRRGCAGIRGHSRPDRPCTAFGLCPR